ncbi:hypothetical protein L1887_46953 [Cichorium endivia]|nr:hypothetical protein L1887_46953 [Cichorium endivia]
MALIWVDVPSVEGGQRQDIWMYYGNAKAPSTSNGQQVFDADYSLVYHFGGAEGTPPRDATAYSNNGQTPAGTGVEGVIGRSAQFNGQPLLLPASPSLAWAAGAPFSVSTWVRPDSLEGEQVLLARRVEGHSLILGLSQGAPFIENGQLVVLVNGRENTRLDVAVPAFSGTLAIGWRPGGSATGKQLAAVPRRPRRTAHFPCRPSAAVAPGRCHGPGRRVAPGGLWGRRETVRLRFRQPRLPARRGADRCLGDHCRAGADDDPVVGDHDPQEQQRGPGQPRQRDLRDHFATVGTRLEQLADDPALPGRLQHSSLWRLYQVAVQEMRTRRAQGADLVNISGATIEAIRASMDAVRTRENQALSSRLSTLSNAIAGGPYIGLLGTVMGIMVVFLGTAMAGDVNINAIAPGMAAALLATAMGLFVAIPALFGYNRLVTRNREVGADMRVFVDEFITRLAEVYGEGARTEPAQARAQRPASDGVRSRSWHR